MNVLGLFFKVQPISWEEWLVSLAIGAGAWPLSWATRFISRFVCARAPGQSAKTWGPGPQQPAATNAHMHTQPSFQPPPPRPRPP